ncbi:MAG: [FeFe] hydrogenase H-cluster radical SAM maturase HydE [Ignavibacteria bacterium GWF2_33_9]|nr:MAG: [FeFe] hydrogenase H-cluster radical SAM maturase HydE [Ignavibacteria bacterium GWF2_33_9]
MFDNFKISRELLIELLKTPLEAADLLFNFANETKFRTIGNNVHIRGIIELSNICSKDCYYCGIRKSNPNFSRYEMSNEEVLELVQIAQNAGYTSIVLQSGEISNDTFSDKIENLIKSISKTTDSRMRLTLSLGEQSKDTYKRWFDAGANRYLLRIESSNPDLYYKIHPQNKKHNFENRLECLSYLKQIGYQVGTGVMIGLPFQTYEDLADDLLFMRDLDIDMCGMGPYLEHIDTPLFQYKDTLFKQDERLFLAQKMIAALRLIMPDINIAAATSLQAINPNGKLLAISSGGNIIMPNITPKKYREEYRIYDNKPMNNNLTNNFLDELVKDIHSINHEIVLSEWGDSFHFNK